MNNSMPSIFLAHGAPMLLDDANWMGELSAWATNMPKPTSILMISAHWTEAPVTLGATETIPLVYDFYGFPERYYDIKYPAPGAPELSARVRALLAPTQKVAEEKDRGLDHGAYVPLIAMYPDANVPVLQLSIPTMNTKTLLELGRALAPLRDEGTLIIGSGFLTHNLREIDRHSGPPPAWATEFDAWTADALTRNDVDALSQYRSRAPAVDIALPTHEHFVPLFVTLGANLDRGSALSFPITGYWMGSLTKRSVQYG